MDTELRELTNFVNELIEESEPFRDFLYSSTDYDWEAFGRWLDDMYNYEIEHFYGASKGVLIFADNDYVIKFPFLTDQNNKDYCRLEWRNYILAKEEDLEDCFAETGFLGNFNFVDNYNEEHVFPVYYQEKINCDEDVISDEMYESAYKSYLNCTGDDDSEETRDKFSDSYYEMDSDEQMESFAYDKFGDDIAARFCAFCVVHHINDLHSGNWGYSGNLAVVTDFSGYGNEEAFRGNWDECCPM